MDKTQLASQIKEHMEIVNSNDQFFAIVDNVEGDAIKLTKDAEGNHHYIPISWVSHVDTHVHLNLPGDQVMQRWTTEAPVGSASSSGMQKS